MTNITFVVMQVVMAFFSVGIVLKMSKSEKPILYSVNTFLANVGSRKSNSRKQIFVDFHNIKIHSNVFLPI